MSQDDLQDLAKAVAGWAGPGEQVEAYVVRSRTTGIRVYEGAIESLSSNEPAGAGIRVISNGRQGFAWAGVLDETVLKETLEEARDNAAFSEPDEWVGLASDDGTSAPELDLVRAGFAAVPMATKIELAMELERLTRGRDPRVTGLRNARYTDSFYEMAVATTTGICVGYADADCAVSVTPLVEADGDTQIGDGSATARIAHDLDLAQAAADGVDRAARLLGATKPRSRRVTAVLDPEVTSEFLAIIGSTLSGDALLKGRSIFANREGELVASDLLDLISDPTDDAGLAASRYDGEGLARRRVSLIEGGRLRTFMHNTYTARRLGTQSTGAASRSYQSIPGVGAPALTVKGGSLSQDELIADVTEGVYVQEVHGLHSGVNPVSGDFSVGATGLTISGGAFGEPFREATIASTLQRMLLDITAVGSDVRWLPGGHAGVTLVIKDVSLGGS